MNEITSEKAQLYLDIAAVMFIVIDADREIRLVNKKACEILGYEKEEELIGKDWFDIFIPERSRDEVRAVFDSLMAGEIEPVEYYDNPVLTRSGEERIIAWHNTVLKDNQGKNYATLSSGEDITERKQMETVLRESEEMHRVLFETAKDAIFLTDETGKFVDVNPAACESLGYSKAELLNMSNRDIDADTSGYEAFQKVRIGMMKEAMFEVNQRRKDGALLPVEITGKFFECGGKRFSLAIARDITERRRAEEALKESKEKLNAMLRSIGDHMSMMDKDLNIIWANETAKKIFGNDIIGKKCYAVYHKRKEPCEPYPCITLRAFQDGKVHEHDTQVIGNEGQTIFFHCTANVALKDEYGKPTAVIELSRDFTERKAAEERIEHLNSVLKTIMNVDQLILVEKDRDRLLQKACNALIDARNYDAAWIGLLKDDERFTTLKGSCLMDAVARFCKHSKAGDFPPCIKNALAQKDSLIVQDKTIDCEDCIFKDSCAGTKTVLIRVEHANRLFGLLAISVAAGVTVSDDEKELLTEVAGDIAFALHNMGLEEERKRANELLAESEKQLRETEAYLNNVIASSADAIVVVDMDGIVRDWNKGAEDYMDYTADEVVGASNKRFYAESEEADRIMETVLREGTLKNHRTTVLNKNKQPVHISISVALLKDRNGVPVGTVRVSRDVTKEVELVERIKAERDNMNQIFESMVDGVYMVSKDYKIEFMNKVLINELGDGIGRICYDVFHNRDEPCTDCKIAEVLKRKVVEWEWYSPRMNKTYDLIETPMRHVDGTVSKLTIFRDVTKRKLAKEQLKLLARSLQEHVEMLEDSKEQITRAYGLREHFLKETSHRIITPVTVIGGYTELMLESRNRDDEQKEMLMTIRERNNEVQKLTWDALAGSYLKEEVY